MTTKIIRCLCCLEPVKLVAPDEAGHRAAWRHLSNLSGFSAAEADCTFPIFELIGPDRFSSNYGGGLFIEDTYIYSKFSFKSKLWAACEKMYKKCNKYPTHVCSIYHTC